MRALVILVRNLTCGYLGSYGNEWVATPTLDRLAAEGIVFDQHYAESSSRTCIIQIADACLFLPNECAISGRARRTADYCA